MVLRFADLRNNYPVPDPEKSDEENRRAFYNTLGGQWPSLVNADHFKNTCATRLSVALKKSGASISDTYKEAIEGNGSPLIIKVKTMSEYLKATVGSSSWGISKNPGTTIGAGDVPGVTGILVYHVAWSNATGHFDLWTGSRFLGSGNFADIKDGFALELWEIS